MLITLPNVLTVDESRAGNPVRQIGELGFQREGSLATFSRGRVHGFLFQPTGGDGEVLIIPTSRHFDEHQRIVFGTVRAETEIADLSGGVWFKHPLLRGDTGNIHHEQEIEQVLESWSGAFSYVQEDLARQIVGLRSPQIGAVHAVHAQWAILETPATIVMPTGTGKTETMLSILCSARCRKLLVVVPTDTLRTQLADKFLTLGVLATPGAGILRMGAKLPIVCTLLHVPRSTEEVDDVFGRAQVIVTTSSIAGQCGSAVQERMAIHCPYLFIDEAHHVEAPTWKAFREKFRERRVVQFTATPFREDGRSLDGDIIFRYPLKKAQQDGYFTSIRFERVVEFNRRKADEAIAARAVQRLREEVEKGHILMARVESVTRANEVFELYKRYQEFNPVQLHTGIKSSRQRESIRRQIIAGESRIVVCVDMLGEGFDLPELKIAAFHDIRKTLAVTLQLAGRFTRARRDLGNATFVANTADVNVQDELRKLYTRDPDWNVLLPELSERMVGEQISLQQFLSGFTEFTKEIPLKTVRPATSAVVYRTSCAVWTPENFRAGIPALSGCEQVHETINYAKQTLIIVTARRVALPWTDVESLFSWDWELYVVIWIPEQNLLFINSSANAGEYRALAQAVAGQSAALIRGQQVFRSFAGVRRLRFQNVGLSEHLGRNVRYIGRMGSDVGSALHDVQLRHVRKSVLAGSGYEDGAKATVGASRRGRIWSHRRERVDRLAAWCRGVGAKLVDETIDPEEVLRGTLEAKTVVGRPGRMPIAVDWPEAMYTELEGVWSITVGGEEITLSELSLELVDPGLDRPLRFAIVWETGRAELELELFDVEGPNYRFVVLGEERVVVRRGGVEGVEVAEFFYDDPPVMWFADGSALEGNQYVELRVSRPPYDAARIEAWDWTGVDITRESQGHHREANTVQARVIRELRGRDYHLIVDDDGKGEAADIVAVRVEGDFDAALRIEVQFYHCKYSQRATPGQRVEDLYEVCGQAQKSIGWMSSPEKRTDLFTHLLRREARRQETVGASRYEVGDGEMLHTIREMSQLVPLSLAIYVVQAGLSKGRATREQLELLSATENYLMETFQIRFGVIASE